MAHREIDPVNRGHARQMRRRMTQHEMTLWLRLRDRGAGGYRFRRQVPVGPYIVDFACLERRLIIEIDGDQHGHPAALAYDADRTAWLHGEAFAVLRFSNRDIMENLDGVFTIITNALSANPPA